MNAIEIYIYFIVVKILPYDLLHGFIAEDSKQKLFRLLK